MVKIQELPYYRALKSSIPNVIYRMHNLESYLLLSGLTYILLSPRINTNIYYVSIV